MPYCGKCKHECEVDIQDDSFDHHFGVEIRYSAYSACCGAELYCNIDESDPDNPTLTDKWGWEEMWAAAHPDPIGYDD